MDVFVGGTGVEGGGLGFEAHGVEGVDELVSFVGGEDADSFEGPGEGLGAADVAVGEALVEGEGLREFLEGGRGAGGEAAAPELNLVGIGHRKLI